MHNVWHTIKNYRTWKEAGKYNPMRSKIYKQKSTIGILKLAEDIKTITTTVFHMFKYSSRDMEDIK